MGKPAPLTFELYGGAGDGLTVSVPHWTMRIRVNLTTKIDPKLRWDEGKPFRYWDVCGRDEPADFVVNYVWSERRKRYEAAELVA